VGLLFPLLALPEIRLLCMHQEAGCPPSRASFALQGEIAPAPSNSDNAARCAWADRIFESAIGVPSEGGVSTDVAGIMVEGMVEERQPRLHLSPFFCLPLACPGINDVWWWDDDECVCLLLPCALGNACECHVCGYVCANGSYSFMHTYGTDCLPCCAFRLGSYDYTTGAQSPLPDVGYTTASMRRWGGMWRQYGEREARVPRDVLCFPFCCCSHPCIAQPTDREHSESSNLRVRLTPRSEDICCYPCCCFSHPFHSPPPLEPRACLIPR
jgi:hypothetical protein